MTADNLQVSTNASSPVFKTPNITVNFYHSTKTLQILGKKSDTFKQCLLSDFVNGDTANEHEEPSMGNVSLEKLERPSSEHEAAILVDEATEDNGLCSTRLKGELNNLFSEINNIKGSLNQEKDTDRYYSLTN